MKTKGLGLENFYGAILMSRLSQINRNSTHFTKFYVKTSGLIIMHQTVLISILSIYLIE